LQVPPTPLQVPFAHSKLLLQVVPGVFSVLLQMAVAGTVSQNDPVAQPTLVPAGGVPVTLHEVAQAVPLAQAKLFGQAPGVPALHVPVPLQVPAGVNVLPVHASPQAVLDEVSSQTAPVVQLPVNPHGGAAVH
jgi:hypothetical protein